MDAQAIRRSRPVFTNNTLRGLPSDRRHQHQLDFPELEVLFEERFRHKGKNRTEASRHLTGQDHEDFILEQFVARLSRDFVGRQKVLAELLELALGPDLPQATWGVCLVGEPGAGKSAVFAQLYLHLRQEDRKISGPRPGGLSDSYKILFPSPETVKCLVLGHAAGVSSRSRQLDGLLRRWVRELAGFLAEADPAPALTARHDLAQAFSRLLARATSRTRVVCLLDGLDQLADIPNALQLSWLPVLWPENARFIATTASGRESDGLARLPGVEIRSLGFLSPGEMAAMTACLCRSYQRELAPAILAALIGKERPDGHPAAGLPLWLKLAVAELLLGEADNFCRSGEKASGAIEAQVHAQLMDAATNLPAELDALYPCLLTRLDEDHSRIWVREFLHLLAVTRQGLRENDFQALLPRRTGRPWEEGGFAACRRHLRAHLVQQGPWGQWHFANAEMQQAILEEGLADPADRQALHRTIALYLEELPREDPLRRTELMFHLIGADNRPQAACFYAGLDADDPELAPASEALAAHIQAGAAQDPNHGLAWVLSLPTQPGLSPGQVASLNYNCIVHLLKVLGEHAAVPLGLGLAQGIRRFQAALAAADPHNPDGQRDLSRAHIIVGDLLRTQGDLTGALTAYRESLAIDARLAAGDPANVRRQIDLGTDHERLGSLLEAMGDLRGAWSEIRKQQHILEKLAAAAPGNADWQQALAVCQERLGDVLKGQGDLARALTACRQSLAWHWVLAAAAPKHSGRQRDLSCSHEKLGDVLLAQGDLQGALTSYRDSLALRQPLAASEPGNVQWQKELGESQAKVGLVLQSLGDLQGALSALQKQQSIAGHLADADPTHTGRQRDLWASHQQVGEVLLAQGNLGEALEAFQESLRLARRLTAANPANADWQRNRAVSHEKLGDLCRTQGNLTGSLSQFREALSLYQALAAADPRQAQGQRRLAVCHEKMGDVFQVQGELTAALKAYGEALTRRRQLAGADPVNTRWQQELAVSHGKMGDLLRAWGDLEGAITSYGESVALNQRLLAAAPTHAGQQLDLAASHEKVGEVLQEQGDLAGALASFKESLALRRHLATADPGQVSRQRDLALSLGQMGEVLRALGDLAGGLAAFREELALARQLAATGLADAEKQRYLAVCQVKVADLLFVQKDLSGAQTAYLESLAIKQQLPAADPTSAVWQRDLVVSYYKLAGATMAESPENRHYWVLCLKTLRDMRTRGMLLNQPLPQLLAQLEKKFG